MERFEELINRRESCRQYDPRPVEREKLELCVQAGRLAPSACNSQPWRFTVVTRKKLLPRVAGCVQMLGLNKFTAQCPAFVVVTEERAKLMERVAGAVGNQHFAPVDIGIAAAHIVLQAADLGLGSCILGMFQEEKLKELLELPRESRVRLVIALGYPAEVKEPRAKVRKDAEQVIRFVEEDPA